MRLQRNVKPALPGGSGTFQKETLEDGAEKDVYVRFVPILDDEGGDWRERRESQDEKPDELKTKEEREQERKEAAEKADWEKRLAKQKQEQELRQQARKRKMQQKSKRRRR